MASGDLLVRQRLPGANDQLQLLSNHGVAQSRAAQLTSQRGLQDTREARQTAHRYAAHRLRGQQVLGRALVRLHSVCARDHDSCPAVIYFYFSSCYSRVLKT